LFVKKKRFIYKKEMYPYDDDDEDFANIVVVHMVDGLTVGSTYKKTILKTENKCCCLTKSKKKCLNRHKICYKLSNGDHYFTCGLLPHRKKIMDLCVNDRTATVMYLKRIEPSKISNNHDEYIYVVNAIEANSNCNIEYPNVLETEKPIQIKNQLIVKKRFHHECEIELNAKILFLKKLIKQHKLEINVHWSANQTYRNSICYIDNNTTFEPSKTSQTVLDEVECAICQEKMNEDNAGKLYECNHMFHTKCIKKWFDNNSENMTCPCCRVTCGDDNYYKFKKTRRSLL
jgi:hypothetical protein